ncbi:MAG: alpha-glucosidase C-terminal domain-containing protein, partial [Bacteroidota bacterium]
QLNVKAQMSDKKSLLHFYKRLIALRKTSDAIKYGKIEFVDIDPDVLAYTRTFKNERVFVILNFSEKNIKINDSLVNKFKEILVTNKDDHNADSIIQPNEVRVLE